MTWLLPHQSVAAARASVGTKRFGLLIIDSIKVLKFLKSISISFEIKKMQIIYQNDHKNKIYLFVS
jgi:hypothetical protein